MEQHQGYGQLQVLPCATQVLIEAERVQKKPAKLNFQTMLREEYDVLDFSIVSSKFYTLHVFSGSEATQGVNVSLQRVVSDNKLF